jgi:hypothetical protein
VVMNTHEQMQMRTTSVPDMNVTLEMPRLICAVFDAVQQTNWPLPSRNAPEEATPNNILQSLLTYCYAVGIVGSNEIATAAIQDPAVRYLSANYLPTCEELRFFRRRHNTFLTAALANLFRILAKSATDTYSSYSLERVGRFSRNHNFQHLAAQRLARAIEMDSHALDF